MQEDSEKCELQKSVIKVMNEKLRILPQQNGIMIALNGKPLISEFFSDSLEIANTVRKTILASSFDTTNMSRSQINKSDVERFLDEVLGTKIHALNNEDWGVHLSGGTDSLDTHLTKDSGERLLRMSTLNRSHPALIGV
jgi:sulfur transfer complex TusBCD TusB component (DsrH family)